MMALSLAGIYSSFGLSVRSMVPLTAQHRRSTVSRDHPDLAKT